ncbi:MAG: transglutaminase domain-containing protein [Anaerolineae bacterium]|nr:transglutaminase domain-containing protein [Anaerolineae bacterium]
MTTRDVSLPRWARRLSRSWQRAFAPGDLAGLVIAAVLLMMPAFALVAAAWPLSASTLYPVTLLSVLFGFMLARSQYNELLGLLISGIYGACFVLLIAALNQPTGLGDGIYTVFSRLFQWLLDASTGGINQDDLVFTLLVSSLFWFLGYNLAWHLFRVDRVWRAILPPALILISNSVYYTGDAYLATYMIAFTCRALLLIVRSNLDAREWDWYVNGIRVPRKLRRQVFRVGVLLALIVLIGAWAVPRADIEERLTNFQEFMQSEPLAQLSEFWNRLFSSADTQGPSTADYYGGDSLQLGGAIRLGDQTVFLVSAPQGRRYYWRSRVYDNYNAGRWTSAADTRLTDPEAPLNVEYEDFLPGVRVPVQQTFTMGLSASRLIYTAPQPLRVDLATRTDLRYVPDANLVGQDMLISVIRPLQVLYRGDSYVATSLMSAATAAQLRSAGENYPQWVRDLYGSYIPSATGRTIQLATEIVAQAGAQTPYDKAKAIETWLRENIAYNETIPQPPADQDPVDWVVFDLRQGYCNYYASAMVVMLRTIGIPARMAAGFAQGTWNTSEQAFVVEERDAHTWVEVYFPGYGWIDFEPTAAQSPLNRGDDPLVPPPQPTELPPTDTPTPTFTPTPIPTNTPETAIENVPSLEPTQGTPTLTATVTPSMTASPMIVPTEPPPLRPQSRDASSFLVSALGIALLALFVILAVLGLLTFIYWWWEWRGMKGLSPIARAYARLERYLGLVGIHLRHDQTPDERRKIIVRDLPAAEPSVTAITRMYIRERYGPGRRPSTEKTPQGQVADRAWMDARGNILQRFLRRVFMPWRK